MHFLRCLLLLSSLVYSASSCLVVNTVPTSTKPPEEGCCRSPELASEEFINETFIQTVPNSVLADYQDVIRENCTFELHCLGNYPQETFQYNAFVITQSSADPEVKNVLMWKEVVWKCPLGSDLYRTGEDEIIAVGCYIIMLVP